MTITTCAHATLHVRAEGDGLDCRSWLGQGWVCAEHRPVPCAFPASVLGPWY